MISTPEQLPATLESHLGNVDRNKRKEFVNANAKEFGLSNILKGNYKMSSSQNEALIAFLNLPNNKAFRAKWEKELMSISEKKNQDVAKIVTPRKNFLNEIIAQWKTFIAKTTGYWPAPQSVVEDRFWVWTKKSKKVHEMEWWYKDMKGNTIWGQHTVEAFESWKSPYIAVSMDSSQFSYGTRLASPEFPWYVFQVVDTWNAFKWKWTSKVDIATDSYDRMNTFSKNGVKFQVIT
jgi:hypothetical protein